MNNKKVVKSKNLQEKKKQKKKKRIIFCLECFVFLLILLVYFIINLINNKDINKNTKLSEKIDTKDSYKINESYIFKGSNPNNYLEYNHLLFRIISINKDGSIDIVLNDYINILSNKNNNINKYLNDILLSNLNKEDLLKVSYCKDNIKDINDFKCNKIVTNDYIRLPSIEDIVNSLEDEESYLLTDYNYYLNNNSKEGSYAIIDKKISLTESTDLYSVRPVIRLNNNLIIETGKGTKDNPYIINITDKITIGSYIKLDNDIWIVHNVLEDKIGLTLIDNLPINQQFGSNNKYDPDSKNNIAYYLNTTYLDSLEYKDLIIDNKWYIGTYNNNYKNIIKKSITAKVGMLNINDLKFTKTDYYYLITPYEEQIYIYSPNYLISNIELENNIVPSIYIAKNNIESGNGSYEDPFILEVIS